MHYAHIVRHSDLGAIAEELANSPVISLDLETTGLSPLVAQIRLLSLNTGKGVYVVDCFQTGRPEPIVEALRAYKGVVIGQGLKFDQKFLLHHWDLELPQVFDTYRASALIYNGRFPNRRRRAESISLLLPEFEPQSEEDTNEHHLYALYERELGIRDHAPDLGGSNWSKPNLDEAQLRYAAEDVTYLPLLRDALRPKLIREGLGRVAQIEFNAILPEAAMENNGFGFDKERWLALAASNRLKAEELRQRLMQELPHPRGQVGLFGAAEFNLQSPEQLLLSLNKLGMGIPDTSEITLAMKAAEFPVIKTLLEWRGFAQAVKTFGPEYLKHVGPDGRIHTSFYPFTGAGRYSSGRPNLQQIPRLKAFRECFRAAPGTKLVLRDYSQIELRIAAEEARDEALMGVYMRGEDAHQTTASLISEVPLDQVTKEQRQMAKPVNFGFLYGMMAPKFVLYAQSNYGVSLTLAQAETFRERYFQGYRGMARWHREVFSKSHRARGFTKTRLGRIRYLAEDSYNEYANTPVQGSGADGLKNSLRITYELLKRYGVAMRMTHMVHDEIILEVDNDPELLRLADRALEQGMYEGMAPVLKRVPIVTEGGVADSWAEK